MNDKAADLIEAQMTHIALKAAEEAIARKLPVYSALPPTQLSQLLLPAISMFVRYLRNGDAGEYRDYVRKACETRIAQGYNTDDVLTVTTIIGDALRNFVTQKLGGDTYARERSAVERRIDGIVTLAYSTITATQAAHRIQRSS